MIVVIEDEEKISLEQVVGSDNPSKIIDVNLFVSWNIWLPIDVTFPEIIIFVKLYILINDPNSMFDTEFGIINDSIFDAYENEHSQIDSTPNGTVYFLLKRPPG